jgi:rubrerythrin
MGVVFGTRNPAAVPGAWPGGRGGRMTKDVKLCLDILAKAIAFEEEGIRFFNQKAGTAGSDLERRIFQSLAKDEVGHREHLMKMREELLRTNNLEVLAHHDDHQHRGPREIFETALAGAQNPYDYVPADLEIIRGAMQVERRGYTMYAEAARTVESPLARDLFLHLAEEEQHHYQLLSNTHDYLENPEKWHGYDESPMLDGG